MQQLTGVDGIFLCVDASPASNGVIGSFLIYDIPADDPEAGSAARMRQRITERLDALPPFRRIITGVPVGINNAYLHETDVDVDQHVSEVAVASPGGEFEVAAAVAAAMEKDLPEGRPLWELIVLTGLANNQIAHLMRVHHGAMDGGTMQVVVDYLSDEPTMKADPNDARPDEKSGVPAKLEVLGRGLVNNAKTPFDMMKVGAKTGKYLVDRSREEGAIALPALVARMVPGEMGAPFRLLVNAAQKARGKPEVRALVPTLRVPHTPFNAKITDRRNFAYADHALDDFKGLGKAMGVTMNDVVVAVCAGAIRRYLIDNGGVPDRPLVLSVPVSFRTGEEKERWANYASGFWADLPTHIADPIERLREVHTDLSEGKKTFDALPKNVIRDVARLMMPLTALNVYYRVMGMAPDWLPGTLWNVIISNVRGPAKTINVCGAQMVGYWPVGFLNPGTGLNITLQSYRDRLCFGFLGCPDLVPDLEIMTKHMEESLEELKEAVADHMATANA